MIERGRVVAALEAKRGVFHAWVQQQRALGRAAEERLERFCALSSAEIDAALEARGVTWPGARPTHELDRAERLRLPFSHTWSDHQQARGWARSVLTGRPVAAVDGSQIAPNKELSLAVGAVQVAWFINDHAEGGRYLKDVDFEVIPPGEVDGDDGDEGAAEGGGFPTWYVEVKRFVGECDRLQVLAEEFGRAGGANPLLLFDGSFVISFVGQMLPQRSQPYLEAVESLLRASALWRVPVVAFVDSTFSRDVVNLVGWVTDATDKRFATDASLLDALLPHWGDRSPVFLCARDDALSRDGRAGFYTDVAFAYVRLTQDRPPARVEMPRWVFDAGLADDIFDLVRAECVVGNGYPYALESADALAVITSQDRGRFLALFEQFAAREGIPLRRARKAQSKLERRA